MSSSHGTNAAVQFEGDKKRSVSSEVEHSGADGGHAGGRMVKRAWRTRFGDQFSALVYKQCLVYGRNLRATLLRLLAPLFFMLLLWLLDLAFRADNVNLESFENNPTPSVLQLGAVTPCESDVYGRKPCYDFVYSPAGDAVADAIVSAVRLSNPGRAIPAESVLGFASIAAANAWLLSNPERTTGGVHFLLGANAVGATGPGINYVLQVNSTTKYFKNRFQDPTFFAAVPLQTAVEREIARYEWAADGQASPLAWDVSISQFAHPTTGTINIVGQALGPFVFAANMFNFVLLLASIVAERERGLRQALTTSGMLDSAYWASWLVVELAISVVFSLLLVAFGAMFGFAFFLKNSFAVVFLLFVLFQWAMVGVAFMLAAFIRRAATAVYVGFVIFIVGWIVQSAVAFDYPFAPAYYSSQPAITVIFTLMPWAPLAKAAIDLGLAVSRGSGGGISWSRRSEYCQNLDTAAQADALYLTDPSVYWDFECVFPIGSILLVLFVESVVYALLAVYLDNVVPNENGVRKSLWYCFSPAYWCGVGRGRVGAARGSVSVKTSRGVRMLAPPIACPIEAVQTDPDVAAEEAEMRGLLQHRAAPQGDAVALEADRVNAVEVYGLQKVFGRQACGGGGGGACCGCLACCRGGAKGGCKAFWAIKGSWFAIERGRVFCLLGPNGAGKTTTINCLTGVLPPSGGDALVYGESINAPGGMDRVRALMGVCPQFDVLWGELTGAEHMTIYGRVKGLPRAQVKRQAGELLENVKLTEAAPQRTAAYSGGMRRRLSVAIALLGDPLVVYLDEPTTGMDPISRRHVWDAIEAVKPGRAIVLTTHSMEEADILGDSVAIMARGRVRAFGSSLRLKQRFGSGYQLSVAVAGAKGLKSSASAAALGGPAGDAAAPAAAAAAVDAVAQRVAAVQALFRRELGVEAAEGSAGSYLLFLVPKDREPRLPAFLRRLEEDRAALGVTDVQISLTSLEEVFLSIARAAELEAAAAEGRDDVVVTLEDGSALKVPLGDEYATQAATGVKYLIKWAQDESGRLQVLSWTPVRGGAPSPGGGGGELEAPQAAGGMARA